jgi:hypothetical protein
MLRVHDTGTGGLLVTTDCFIPSKICQCHATPREIEKKPLS